VTKEVTFMYTLFISTYDKLINISLLKNGKKVSILEEIRDLLKEKKSKNNI